MSHQRYKDHTRKPHDHKQDDQDYDMRDAQDAFRNSPGHQDYPPRGYTHTQGGVAGRGGATSVRDQQRHHHHQGGFGFSPHEDRYLSGDTSGRGRQMYHQGYPQQDQKQLFRCEEASRQILYDTYDYTIGMIEELEKHETHGSQVQNSGILSGIIPMFNKKPKIDVMAGIELELQCLDVQMQAIPQDIISAAKEDLVKRTLRWAAVRSEHGVPFGNVDRYGQNVLRILLKYSMQLPPRERGPNTITEEQVNKAMYEVAKGRHYGDKQDEEFNKDPKKKAKLRDVRQGDLREGAKRLTHGDKTLEKDLLKYITDFDVDLK